MPTCPKCKKEFTPLRAAGRPQKYCKNPCGGLPTHREAKPPTPATERFWQRVDTSGGSDACWNWRGTPNTKGYGVFHVGVINGRITQTTPNKFALEEKLGRKLIEGEQALRICRNHACVNPAHLYPGREVLLEEGPTHECKKCGKPFQVTRVSGKPQQYCSAICRSNGTYTPSLRTSEEDRFWSHVTIRGSDECWPWSGATVGDGYGLFTLATVDGIRGKQVTANSYSLSLVLGRRLATGEQAGHKCDNPPCCNPAHLFLTDAAGNSADMRAKGRQGRTGPTGSGTLRGVAKEEVEALTRSGMSQGKVAAQYGVHQTSISKLLKR